MEFRHSKSSVMPWNRAGKIAELKDPLTQYVIAFDKSNTVAVPVGFASFQLTTEDDVNGSPIPCLYLYELHVAKTVQGCGLGSLLLKEVEAIGQENRQVCQKIMLTAFKALPRNRLYKSPVAFYQKYGYRPDPISPSQCLSSKEAVIYDYEIMSKPIVSD